MKKDRTTIRRSLRRKFLGFALALWAIVMVLLTLTGAVHMRDEMDSPRRPYYWGRYVADLDQTLPGAMEYGAISQMSFPYHAVGVSPLPFMLPQTPGSYGSDDWFWGKWDLLYGFEPAVCYVDKAGNILAQSGSYLTFFYMDSTAWSNRIAKAQGYGFIDLEAIDGGVEIFDPMISDFPSHIIGPTISLLRMTGRFEGARFIPHTMDRGSYVDSIGWVDDPARLCHADARGKVEWETLLANTGASGDQTIYAWNIGGTIRSFAPFTCQGYRYESLPDFLRQVLTNTSGERIYSSDSLLQTVLYHAYPGEDDFGPFTVYFAVRCCPIGYSALRMIPTYLISLAAVLLTVFLLLRRISKQLTEPVEYLCRSMEQGTSLVPQAQLKDVYILESHFAAARQALADANAHSLQLQATLEYAHSAEENRRQLVSGITHDLKTPLSVIHSYAEALQADIDPEKREAYLAVIQKAAQRMDAQVLQMLDLSRLEAGKVRLASDTVSMPVLIRSAAQALAPLAGQRQLEMLFDMPQELLITADGARMHQAVTNLLGNAVKYAPEDSQIHVRLRLQERKVCFTVENLSEPLSKEALEKVFDSFYRADSARSTPGTGLGLAVVKGIVKLHGGTCYAQNRLHLLSDGAHRTSVEFGFTIPLP